MSFENDSYKFHLIDERGHALSATSFIGALKGRPTHKGKLESNDELVVAIRDALENKQLSDREQLLLRSFLVCWLTGSKKKLGNVVAFSVKLPDAVAIVGRIGLLGRSAQSLVSGTRSVVETVLLLDVVWDVATGNFGIPSPGEVVVSAATDIALDWVLPDNIFKSIDESYGQPGNPSPAVAYDAECTVSFLQLCQVSTCLGKTNLESRTTAQLQQKLDQRILALFLSNSRQIEGLVLSGSAQASSAVVAHAALALGLAHNERRNEILDSIEKGITFLKCEIRIAEANATLAGIRNNLNKDINEIERRIRRNTSSAMTTDAIDLATAPVTLTIDMLATIAKGLGSVSGSKGSVAFKTAEQGFNLASRAVGETPGVLGQIIKGGLSSEEWVQGFARKMWPLKNRTSPDKE